MSNLKGGSGALVDYDPEGLVYVVVRESRDLLFYDIRNVTVGDFKSLTDVSLFDCTFLR
jgi:hypothetical protein